MAAKSGKITGADKAAILLLYLGPDVTGKVFEHLEDETIARISSSMTRLGHVKSDLISQVADEYREHLDPDSGLFGQGEDYVKKMLEKTLGTKKAEAILQELYNSSRGDLTDIIGDLDAKTVANFLSQEHPQTVAVILAKLRPKQTSEIIALLPQDMQAEVVVRIADVDQVSPEILAEIDEVIEKELTASGSIQRFKVGGLDKVVDLFNYFDRGKERQILERLDVLNPPLAEIIRKHLFTFEDLINMDDKSIQSIMREVSNDVLTLAMKTGSEDLKEKIFRNISSRAAEMIKEDLEVMGPVRLFDVEKAQSEIIKVVRRLEEEGKIVVAGRGSDDVLV